MNNFYEYEISMIEPPHTEEFYKFCMLHLIDISINGPEYSTATVAGNTSRPPSYMVKEATIDLKVPSDEVNDLFLLRFSDIITILSLNIHTSKFHYEHLTRI